MTRMNDGKAVLTALDDGLVTSKAGPSRWQSAMINQAAEMVKIAIGDYQAAAALIATPTASPK